MAARPESKVSGRLKRIEGQVRGIGRMLDDHRPCEEVLVQIMAVKAALDGLVATLAETEMEACLAGADVDAMRVKMARTIQLLCRGA